MADLIDWIFATSDLVEPTDYCTGELARYDALTPEQQAAEDAASTARRDAAHAEWLASGEPDLLAELQEKRTADRATAGAEKTAIDKAHRTVCMAADSTDEQVEAADALYEAAIVDWHLRFDHLWSAAAMKRTAARFDEDQKTYLEQVAAAEAAKKDKETMATAPALPPGTPVPAGAVSMIGGPAPMGSPPEFSEIELANRFVERHAKELRFVSQWNKWLRWNGHRWEFDKTLHIFDLARELCREESILCASRPGPNSGAKAISSAKTVAAVVALARTDRRVAATVDQWDADIWLLNTADGVVDLHTGKLRHARPEDYMTKSTAVAPSGGCPLWLAFLSRITNGDVELQAFMQRIAGYSLTGSTREHALFFGYGTGANGKTTFVDTIASIFGAYHCTAPIETFTATTTDRHPTEIADLRGARLVTAAETEQGRRWAESRIKMLTGGEKVKARHMRQDLFEFTPQLKLLITGNHKPSLRSADEAMRRRFNLLPFTVTIPPGERDHELPHKLRAEWPGILSWMIQGCLDWQRGGLQAPTVVREATEAYMDAEDALGAWLNERCDRDPQARETLTSLYADWRSWAERSGEFAGTNRALGAKLVDQGFAQHKTNRGQAHIGLRLRPWMQAPVGAGTAPVSGQTEVPPPPSVH